MFLESLKHSFTYTFPCSHKIPNSTRGLYILYSQMAYYFMVQNWSEVLPKKVKEKTGRKHPITCTAQDLGLRCLHHQSLGLCSLQATRSFSVKPRTITLIACLLVFFMTPTSSFGSTNVTKTMILILNGIIKNKISMARKLAYWSSKAACDVSIYLKFDVSQSLVITYYDHLSLKLKTKGIKIKNQILT